MTGPFEESATFDVMSWSAAELVARSEFLHEEVVTVAIFGAVPLSEAERAQYQPFIDAMLEFWSSGEVTGLAATYADALRAFEALLEERSADNTSSSRKDGAA